MSQATDVDSRELKELILELDKRIDTLDKKVEFGFTKLEGKIDGLHTLLTTVENRVSGLDNRLWTFGGIIPTAAPDAL
jgi:hypothetical protein